MKNIGDLKAIGINRTNAEKVVYTTYASPESNLKRRLRNKPEQSEPKEF